MRAIRFLYISGAVILSIAGYLVMPRTRLHAQQSASVRIGQNDIGGVVSSSKGPEAGVWVIAETTDLPTRYIKEVVTDDRGRYLVPDLPKANYDVWARGYGLVDSPKVKTGARQAGRSEAHRGAGYKDRRALLPGHVLVFACERAEAGRISGDRRGGQRHFADRQEPSPVAGGNEDRRLRSLPPGWQRVHAHDSSHVQQSRPRSRRGCAACSRDKPPGKCSAAR